MTKISSLIPIVKGFLSLIMSSWRYTLYTIDEDTARYTLQGWRNLEFL